MRQNGSAASGGGWRAAWRCARTIVCFDGGLYWLDHLAILGLSALLFHRVLAGKIGFAYDFNRHLEVLGHWLQGRGHLPGHGLFHLLVGAVALGSADPAALGRAAMLVAAFCVVWKYAVMKNVLLSVQRGGAEGVEDPVPEGAARRGRAWWSATLGALGLLVAMAIPSDLDARTVWQRYLSPTQWHNPTQLLVYPLALCLHWWSFRFLLTGERAYLSLLLPAFLANAFAKPAYALPFLPVFAPASLWRGWRRGSLGGTVAVLALMGGAVVAQYVYIYVWNPDAINSKIIFAPFVVWRYYVHDIPLSLAMSLALPLAYLLLFPARARADWFFAYSWAIFAVALVCLASLAESGEFMYHGNFAWLANATIFVLYASAAGGLLRHLRRVGFAAHPLRFATAAAVFALHVAAGLGYLGYLVAGGLRL